jgi:ribosome-associated protein
MFLQILSINYSELKFTFTTSTGPGGQNVNKVATAVELRFNVTASASLSLEIKERLTILAGKRMTAQGELIIQASRYRTQERNKQDAISRFQGLIKLATLIKKKRKKTKPTFASTQRRLAAKKINSRNKALRNYRES